MIKIKSYFTLFIHRKGHDYTVLLMSVIWEGVVCTHPWNRKRNDSNDHKVTFSGKVHHFIKLARCNNEEECGLHGNGYNGTQGQVILINDVGP